MKLKDFIPQGILPDAEKDAIAFLRADHDKLEDLFSSFDEIRYGRAGDGKKNVVAEVCRQIRLHAAVEEKLFYPAVRAEIVDDDLMNEAMVEHEGIRRLVSEIEMMDPDDEMLNAKMHVLDAYLVHHMREEEENIFPKARETGLDMVVLAGRMARYRQRLVQAETGKGTRTERRSRPRPVSHESRHSR